MTIRLSETHKGQPLFTQRKGFEEAPGMPDVNSL